jgi:ATP-dependent DNA helicase RecQ
MSDQVSSLLRKRMPATFLNSDIGATEKELRLQLLERGTFKFLYLAPERFFGANAQEMALLDRLRPSYLVVDEAHCIDRWGRDFRPEYGRLREVRARLGNPPVLAFTATAGRDAQTQILGSLGIPDAQVFVHGVNRPNICFYRQIVARDRRPAFIADLLLIAQRSGMKAMVFVPTRKIGDEVAHYLGLMGMDTPFFHGQLSTQQKEISCSGSAITLSPS